MDEELEENPDCPGCRKRDERIEELERRVEELLGRVASLEAQLDKDSTNSSKPPSSDGPAERAEREGSAESPRQQGAQPGHEGHHREDVDPSEVDEIEDHKPDECRGCGRQLSGSDTDPATHQVTDLRVVKTVTEHRQHTLECDGCGAWTTAELPEEAPSSQFGPVVSAIVTYLTGKAHLSKRLARETMADVFGVEMALGTVSNKEATATEALLRSAQFDGSVGVSVHAA